MDFSSKAISPRGAEGWRDGGRREEGGQEGWEVREPRGGARGGGGINKSWKLVNGGCWGRRLYIHPLQLVSSCHLSSKNTTNG